MTAALWWTAGALVATRILYPRILEWRHRFRFAITADGTIAGADPIDLPLADAVGVLLLHGAGDTPQSLRGLAEYLHARGYSVRVPLLESHGRSLGRLRECSATAWRAQVQVEYATMRSKHRAVAVVGQSLGGALAIVLAGQADPCALVLLAPWVAMKEPIRTVARVSRLWGWLFPLVPSLGGDSIHDPHARAQALTRGIVTPSELRALSTAATWANRALEQVRAATLTLQSREDKRISSDAAQGAFDRLGAADKRLEWIAGAGHVLSVDFGRDRVFSLAAEWLDTHCAR